MPPTQLPTASPAPADSQNSTKPSASEQPPSTSPNDQLDCSNATSFHDIIHCADFNIPKLNCSNPTSNLDTILCANFTFPELNCSNPTSDLDIIRCANCSNPTSDLDIIRCANFTFPGLNCTNATSELDIIRCANVTLRNNVPCFRCLRGLTVAGLFDEVRLAWWQSQLSDCWLHLCTSGPQLHSAERNKSSRGIHQVVDNLRDVIGYLLSNGSLQPDELQTAGFTLGRSIRYFRNQRYLNRDALDVSYHCILNSTFYI